MNDAADKPKNHLRSHKLGLKPMSKASTFQTALRVNSYVVFKETAKAQKFFNVDDLEDVSCKISEQFQESLCQFNDDLRVNVIEVGDLVFVEGTDGTWKHTDLRDETGDITIKHTLASNLSITLEII